MWSRRRLYRAVLAGGIAVVSMAAPRAPFAVVKANRASTWYWQNPLPRAYFVESIACGSVTACVAVGDHTIVTTNDGGQHWTDRSSGSKIGLGSVTCPGPAICYALGGNVTGSNPQGRPPNVEWRILKSRDGGRTWLQLSPQPPNGTPRYPEDLVCPSVTTCLVGGWNDTAQGDNPLLRTTDGGRTWRAVTLPGLNGFVVVTCATRTACYARVNENGRSSLARSDDSGETWTLHGLHSPGGLAQENANIAIACPAANTCFAIAAPCCEPTAGSIYVTRDGARTWKRVYFGASGGIVCPSTTTCYAFGDRSVVRTVNSGQTWTVRRLRDQELSLACPGPTTCYATTFFGALATRDGFRHTQATLARSVIHGQSLTDISCPNTTSCYASGSRSIQDRCDDGPCVGPASFVATTDGGRTWHAGPTTLDVLERLGCPGQNICFGAASGDPGPIAVDLSDDGTKTWQRIPWQQISNRIDSNNQAADITCVGGTTCYLLATVGEGTPENNVFATRVAVLVTHDTGRTWSVKTGIDASARAGETNIAIVPSRISCPSVATCFVLAKDHSFAGGPDTVVLLSTADGGETWTRHPTVPGTVPSTGYPPLGQDLSCPALTTCYLLSFLQNQEAGNPNGLPGPVLVTHDSGATWQRSVVSSGEYLTAISCATVQSCRVVGSSGISATDDGGMTWQRELLADGSQIPPMVSITCPAVDTCYSVGGPEPCCGVIILATHPSGAPGPTDEVADPAAWTAHQRARTMNASRPHPCSGGHRGRRPLVHQRHAVASESGVLKVNHVSSLACEASVLKKESP